MHTPTIFVIVTDTPPATVNLDNLLIQLRPQIATEWYQFGKAAGIEKEVLDSFLKSCSPEDCIVEMLDYWLRHSVNKPTWNDIAGILRLINHSQLASDIERVYTTGIHSGNLISACISENFVPHTCVANSSNSTAMAMLGGLGLMMTKYITFITCIRASTCM